MNTVDALNVLGKALCGDSFETKPGLTDAETILEIAKNYSGGSGGGHEIIMHISVGEPITFDPLEPGLTVKDLINATWVVEGPALDTILSAENIYAQRNTPVDIGTAYRVPEVGESVSISYYASGATSNYDATVEEANDGVEISSMIGIISIKQDGSATFTAVNASGQQGVSVFGTNSSAPIVATSACKIVEVSTRGAIIDCAVLRDGNLAILEYDPQTGEITVG